MEKNLSPNRPMGWALIGCGRAGKSHAQWASLTPNIVIRGFSDARVDAARRFNEEFEGEYHTTDSKRIFADPSQLISYQLQPPIAPTPIWRLPPYMRRNTSFWRSLWQ